jgi:alcohol dehydrogenase class IV
MNSTISTRWTQWNYPTTVWVGAGRIRELPAACKAAGLQRPLLVTDTGLADHPMIQAAFAGLLSGAPETRLFSQIKSNPTDRNVADGVARFQTGNHDGVVAIGGGSALDAAKAIALMSGQNRPLWDFEDVGDGWTRANSGGIVPLVAVPTTAGTGSEVGRAAVITRESTHEKKIIFHPNMMPVRVILDPELTVGLPPALTAATGIDAFSHGFEAFFAPGFHPLADGIALRGMAIVKDYLPRAVAEGTDLEARLHMLAAAAMGATAFQKGLGAVHGLAHAVGAVHDTPHGLTIGILLPYVLAYNAPAVAAKIVTLSRTLELPGTDARGLLRWLLDFRQRIGIPHTLADLSIPLESVEQISNLAFSDPSTSGNPRSIRATDYADLFRAAHAGSVDLPT